MHANQNKMNSELIEVVRGCVVVVFSLYFVHVFLCGQDRSIETFMHNAYALHACTMTEFNVCSLVKVLIDV